jgi:hypothetical protein
MSPFLNNQRLWPQTCPSGWGAEIKNWADSSLSVFCLSDHGLWLHPCAEVKLFFLPCWVTLKCSFYHCLGMALLTIWHPTWDTLDHWDPLLRGDTSCCLVAAQPNPRLRVTQQRGSGPYRKHHSSQGSSMHRPR